MALSDTIVTTLITSFVTSGIWAVGFWKQNKDKKDAGQEKQVSNEAVVRVEHFHDRQALTDDQQEWIRDLQGEIKDLKKENRDLTEKWLATERTITDLQGKIKENSNTVAQLRDENTKRRQDCEEKITKLADENTSLREDNTALREQLSTSQAENMRLAKALRSLGGDVAEAVRADKVPPKGS